MKVSILIGSRDRPKALIRCLESVMKQDYRPMEVLVLDDNSNGYQLNELLASTFQDPRLRYFRTHTSLGVAGGRNFLMQQAEGDIFCTLDDDAYFSDSRCVSCFVEAFDRHSQVGILAFKIIDHRAGREDLIVPFSRWWRKRRPHLTEKPQLVSYYLGGCHAIHRRVIEQCGGYQDAFVFGLEELDLSYRAIEAGFGIMYFPSVVVHHCPELSAMEQQERHRRLYYYVRNRLFLAYKYLPLIYVPIYLGIWLSALSLSALKQLAFMEFLGGLVVGLRELKKLKRTPLSQQAVRYLKAHYGRLWY